MKAKKKVRFLDDMVTFQELTGVRRIKNLKLKPKNFCKERVTQSYKSYQPELLSCTGPRTKRVLPNLVPNLDFSLDWAKGFLRTISM